MNLDDFAKKINSVKKDRTLQNYIAQAHARYILFNTNVEKENLPRYTIKDEKLNKLAFYYLHAGCVYAENNNLAESSELLERGASILEYINGSINNRELESNYFGLISSLGYYASFQYSKAFILIKKHTYKTEISNLISLFLERKYPELLQKVNEIVVSKDYTDEHISNLQDVKESENKIYVIVIAKSLNSFIRYFQSGDDELMHKAKAQLQNLKEIAELNEDPSVWWVIRLLLIILDGFNEAALWKCLSKHFDIYDDRVKKYINSLIHHSPPYYELFITQRNSLAQVLNVEEKGCIVSVPTSSGKTRIAEIAILNAMLADPYGKVLYIAPFKSLAFEIESTLENIFSNVDITISHLYGGGLFSKLDERVIDESNVIIATPEKAKAIFRGNSDIFEQVKLVIIDEGHLLGADARLLANEVFYEELRYYLSNTGGRFLLLSAVLPNTEDIAKWLTGSTETVYRETWRPSDERFGILEYTNSSINLNWDSTSEEIPSFNPGFIKCEPIPLKGRAKIQRYTPNYQESPAAVAYKLRYFGPALIFVGIKPSVFPMARAYEKFMTEPFDISRYNKEDWKAYELACIETYGIDSLWLYYAGIGILCHHGDLNVDVRIPLERLMRNSKPLVIISTSTLGQGVNLGISTVIFATTQIGKSSYLTKRDFWNIAGRAGRAFIDSEGKILVKLNAEDRSEEGLVKIEKQRKGIKSFFKKSNIDQAVGGLILTIIKILAISERHGIDFNLLITLISENQLDTLDTEDFKAENVLNVIDDSLLSLHYSNNLSGLDETDYSWVEAHFKTSLAAIQGARAANIGEQKVLDIITARVHGIETKVGTSRRQWLSIIKSGIPVNYYLEIENQYESILDCINEYLETDLEIDDKLVLLEKLETLFLQTKLFGDADNYYKDHVQRDVIRDKWLRGISAQEIFPIENSEKIITKIYGYKLPWFLNAVGKKLKQNDLDDQAEVIEELATYTELGLPTLSSCKVYQAGIRSRSAALEISTILGNRMLTKSIIDYKRKLVNDKEILLKKLSGNAKQWLEMLGLNATVREKPIKIVESFIYKLAVGKTETLIPQLINDEQYLVSPDLSFIKKISSSGINFTQLNNLPGIYFKYNKVEKEWNAEVSNPYIKYSYED